MFVGGNLVQIFSSNEITFPFRTLFLVETERDNDEDDDDDGDGKDKDDDVDTSMLAEK